MGKSSDHGVQRIMFLIGYRAHWEGTDWVMQRASTANEGESQQIDGY
jgi:hypothetical protein